LTLAVPTWPTDWQRGQWGTLTLAIDGVSPVRAVTVDLLGDVRPAWYLLLDDARGLVTTVTVGPFAVAGNQAVMVTAQDEQGCEASLGPRTVTIRP
jgi:hypothetical protein